MLSIKRENWKGKYIIVARENGRIASRKKWTFKFTVDKAKRIFKRQRTFSLQIKRTILKNVIETVDSGRMPRKRNSSGLYQVSAFVRIKGQVLSARSMQHDIDFPLEKAKDEALFNLQSRVAEATVGNYEADEGEKFIEDNNLNIKFSTVFYTRR